ncbi:MAG: hypothetical protein HY049_12355 [Acidobacteria bacterium]|nr:hypothetical protein [Acidobacteriota bacterium]
MKKTAMALSIAVTCVLAGPALAHEGHDHKIMGTIAAIDATHVELATKDGPKATIGLNADTKILRGKAQATVGDVKVGERAVVTAIQKDGKMIAREVLLAVAKK